MLMYLTFSNLNSIHWIIKKRYRPLCTFQDKTENCNEMSWKVHKDLYLFFLSSNGLSSNLKMLNTLAGGNNLTWKLSWNFQVKLFPPKQFFFIYFLKYMLMYLTFSGLYLFLLSNGLSSNLKMLNTLAYV
jgi:hypothetical protein